MTSFYGRDHNRKQKQNNFIFHEIMIVFHLKYCNFTVSLNDNSILICLSTVNYDTNIKYNAYGQPIACVLENNLPTLIFVIYTYTCLWCILQYAFLVKKMSSLSPGLKQAMYMSEVYDI